MATRATTKPPDPPAPPEGGGEDLAPGLPGSEVEQCEPGTPGYMQGIAKRPETEAEHDARLGDAAHTAVDVGFVMGTTADPRPNWPAPPVEPKEPVDPDPAPEEPVEPDPEPDPAPTPSTRL